MKRVIIYCIILILIGLLGYFFYEKKGVSIDKGPVVFVLMKDNKFEPEIIKVEKNQKVVFKNQDTKPHWPASNLHPTHGIYPEFDPQQSVNPGDEWSFIFNKVGKWKYHDHLHPNVVGVIEVQE